MCADGFFYINAELDRKRLNVIVVSTIEDLRSELAKLRQVGKKMALVPTMGALHKGHLELIQQASDMADYVAVSIFVNPTQFLPNEDLSKYPRTLQTDLDACEDMGVDLVFTPSTEEMYTKNQFISFSVGQIAKEMCGKSRPGHFVGVVQVVNKLFNLFKPDIAIFGQKDFQQFRIIKAMVEEFNHPVKLIMAPIVREFDGLARSSRNRYLNENERKQAPVLYECIKQIKDQIYQSKSVDISKATTKLNAANLKIDYLGVYSVTDLAPIDKPELGNTYVIAGAVYAGRTRLIDNELIKL
jgi:pantoate--beta-alanine ligase